MVYSYNGGSLGASGAKGKLQSCDAFPLSLNYHFSSWQRLHTGIPNRLIDIQAAHIMSPQQPLS